MKGGISNNQNYEISHREEGRGSKDFIFYLFTSLHY